MSVPDFPAPDPAKMADAMAGNFSLMTNVGAFDACCILPIRQPNAALMAEALRALADRIDASPISTWEHAPRIVILSRHEHAAVVGALRALDRPIDVRECLICRHEVATGRRAANDEDAAAFLAAEAASFGIPVPPTRPAPAAAEPAA